MPLPDVRVHPDASLSCNLYATPARAVFFKTSDSATNYAVAR